MSLTSRATLAWPLVAILALAGCDKVPLLAPTNTTIRLTSGLGVLPIAGTTDITAIVIESAGTPVQNGTVVTFTSSLGTVEPREARTANGQVTVRYVAGSQSGTAKIGAFSGGSKSDDIEILVGAAAAGALSLRADPTAFVPATGGTTDIVATVLDTGGNALRGAPVRFTTTFGQLSQSTALTNDAGEARTQLTTNVTSEVTARIGGGTTATEGKVTITARDLPTIAIEVSSPLGATGTAEIGVPIVFKLTPAANAGVKAARIDFGDGTSSVLGAVNGVTTVTHTYSRSGAFTVTVTATDGLGFSGTSSVVVAVTERGTVPLQVTFTVGTGFVVSFNASASGGFTGTIRTYDWNFGDGQSTTTTGPITSHRYQAAGTYVVRVSVVTTTGQVGFTEVTVRVL